jgi:hypothetical protein
MSEAQFLTVVLLTVPINIAVIVIGIFVNLAGLRNLQAHLDSLFATVAASAPQGTQTSPILPDPPQ